MLGAAALAAALAPGGGWGQEPETRPPLEGWTGPRRGPGMVLDEKGGWRPPTPADALAVFRGEPGVRLPIGWDRGDPALAVLRQEYEFRPAAELDALANALADLILASDSEPEHMSDEYYLQRDAFKTLRWAVWSGRGTPHPGSFDALVRVYETLAARALAGGGTDPIVELRRERPGGLLRVSSALWSIFSADMRGRGADYLLAIVAAAEPPNPEDWPNQWQTLWCDAAHIVRLGTGLPPEENPRRAELPDLALDDEMFYQLCNRH